MSHDACNPVYRPDDPLIVNLRFSALTQRAERYTAIHSPRGGTHAFRD